MNIRNVSDFDWRNRTCLVTGGLGFIGASLSRELLSKGANVIALDRLEHVERTYFGLLGLEKDSLVLRADVRDLDQLATLRAFEFDAVFHLAAQPISPLSNLNPDETMTTNVQGTANLGEVLSTQKEPPVFVFASSACWYGATTTSPLREDDAYVEGEFKYSESKVLAEREVLAIERRYRIPTVRCRFVNLYGPGDRHFSRIIPKTVRHLIQGEQPCLVRNDGSTILDFMRVEDAVSALIVCGERGESIRGEVFNFGVGDRNPRSAVEVVKLTSTLFDGKERLPVLLNPSRPRTKKKYLDNTKAIRALGWRPSRGLEEGLSDTIKWYKENIDTLDHLEF